MTALPGNWVHTAHNVCVSEYKLVYKFCLDNNNLQFDTELGSLLLLLCFRWWG